MSIEYPPTSIPNANTWSKDDSDRTTAIDTTNFANYRTYKTTLSGLTYGNGEYRAWANDLLDNTASHYLDSTSYGTDEWPASGAFDKQLANTNLQSGWHSGQGTIFNNTSDATNPPEIGLDMPQAINLTSYDVVNRNAVSYSIQSPSKWELYGRNEIDGSVVLLDSRSGITWSSQGQTQNFSVTTDLYFTGFYIKLFRNNSASNNNMSFSDLKFYGTPLALQYPPEIMPNGDAWVKDANDTINQHTSGTYRTYKTNLTTAKYGNGEYRVFSNDIRDQTDADTYSATENPPTGAFDTIQTTFDAISTWQSNRQTFTNSSDAATPAIIGIELPEKIKLVYYIIRNRETVGVVQAPQKWELYGRNGEGNTETLLDSQSGISSWTIPETKTFYVDVNEFYSDYILKIYRINNASATALTISNLKFFGNPQESSTTIQKFSELNNNISSGPLAVTGSKKGVSLSQFRDLVETSSISMSQIRDPTYHCGHSYIGGNGDTTRIYFPTKFSTTPGVFISYEPHNPTMGTGTGTTELPYILQVTPEYFVVKNDEDTFTDGVIHWLAVKPGTGTIHGLNYNCKLFDETITLGTNIVFGYDITFSSSAYSLSHVQSNNNSQSIRMAIAARTTTNTTFFPYSNEDVSTTLTNNEIIAVLGIDLSHVSNKIDSDVVSASTTHSGSNISLTSSIFNPVVILTHQMPNSSAQTSDPYIRHLINNQVNVCVKETPGNDGSVSGHIVRALVITGTSDTWKGSERGSRPLVHLDANSLNTRQGMTSGDITRWYSESQSQVKYFIGQGNIPSLGSDSDGYYVDFSGSNEYFALPNNLDFRFQEPIGSSADKGITIFAVFNFEDADNWERIIDFGNGEDVHNILLSRGGTTNDLYFRLGNSTTMRSYNVTGGITNNAYKVYTILYNNITPSCAMYVNNVSQTVNNDFNTYTPINVIRTGSTCYIGKSNWAADSDTNARMRELIIFNDVLTNAQISTINTHLISKWNIS